MSRRWEVTDTRGPGLQRKEERFPIPRSWNPRSVEDTCVQVRGEPDMQISEAYYLLFSGSSGAAAVCEESFYFVIIWVLHGEASGIPAWLLRPSLTSVSIIAVPLWGYGSILSFMERLSNKIKGLWRAHTRLP